MTELFTQAKKLIDASQTIALSTHENPDLDGLGSLLTLASVLQNANKEILPFSLGPAPNFFKLLPLQKILRELKTEKIDLVIGLDYGAPERLEIFNVYPSLQNTKILSFDHHAVGQHLGLKIVDGAISSTAEIIFNFIQFLEAPLGSVEAAYLLAGIMDDTGRFRHNNTSAQTLKIAGQLLLKGASLPKISRAAYDINANEKILALTEVFDKIQLNPRVQLVYAIIEYNAFIRAAAGFNEAGVAEFLSMAPEAKLAASLTEKTPGFYDVSLRSQLDREVNVAQLAQAFGGGGHKLAAGFRSDKTPTEILTQLEKLLLVDFK